MIRLCPTIAVTLFLLGSVAAFADVGDLPQSSDNRIRFLAYDETSVYAITTKYGYQTNIVFSPQEEVSTISVGDRSLWQIIPAGHRIFIRPLDENITTNMTVLTNKRSYQFDLKSLGEGGQGAPVYVAQFAYPAPGATKEKAPEHVLVAPVSAVPPVAQTAKPSASALNYNYTFSGPDALAPTQAYDDGASTYIRYREMGGVMPELFVLDEKGKKTPAVYHVSNGQIISDAVFAKWLLKYKSGSITIYNETLNPK